MGRGINIVGILPEDLISSAINLECIGINEYAWRKKEAIKVIKYLTDKNYAVLGGDVYNLDLNSELNSWYLNKGGFTWTNYVHLSKEKAINYINMFYKKNGDNFYYVIVFANEDSYI